MPYLQCFFIQIWVTFTLNFIVSWFIYIIITVFMCHLFCHISETWELIKPCLNPTSFLDQKFTFIHVHSFLAWIPLHFLIKNLLSFIFVLFLFIFASGWRRGKRMKSITAHYLLEGVPSIFIYGSDFAALLGQVLW